MTEIIGKYKVITDENYLKIRYRYTFSDVIGSFWFLLMFSLGVSLLAVTQKTFRTDSLDSWVIFAIGLFLFGFGTYLLLAGFYNPTKGVFQIDKIRSTIIIRDFLKTHILKVDDYLSLAYDIKSSTRPRTNYSTISLRVKNKGKIDCFIIRSTIPVDFGRKVDKELHLVSRQLRDRIVKTIQEVKNNR